MKKRAFFLCAALSAIAAVPLSYLYAKRESAFLLVLTLIAIAGLLAGIGGFAWCSRSGAARNAVYRKRRYMSGRELSFLATLRSVVGGKYAVCTQVPLVSVVDKPSASFRNELFRVVDFMIASADDYTPLLLIELNDASHSRADRMERDKKVAAICEDAGLPLISFTLAESRDTALVKRRVFGNLPEY